MGYLWVSPAHFLSIANIDVTVWCAAILYRPTLFVLFVLCNGFITHSISNATVTSIIGIIAEANDVLCKTAGFDKDYAYAYIQIINAVSVGWVSPHMFLHSPILILAWRIAMFSLIKLYSATKQETKGRRALTKFICIKLAVFFTVIQETVVSNSYRTLYNDSSLNIPTLVFRPREQGCHKR